MAAYVLKRFSWNIGVCIGTCAVVDCFSPEGRLYAGFTAALLGASYLLAGWLSYLKNSGNDVPGKLKRRRPPQTPYCHRKEKFPKPLLGLAHPKHLFDDDLAAISDEDETTSLPPPVRQKLNAVVYAAIGLLMLMFSLC